MVYVKLNRKTAPLKRNPTKFYKSSFSMVVPEVKARRNQNDSITASEDQLRRKLKEETISHP